AGVNRAKGLICAVDSDATNVYIALLARSMNPDLFIVARAAEPGSADRLYRAGADRVISPYVSSGRHMAMLSLRPKVVDYLEVDAGTRSPLTVEEMLIDRNSPLVNRPIVESCGLASVLAIRQADGRIVANPSVSTTLREGDLILLLGEREVLRPVDSH
ncbi:MAG TPA: NAD-binding protein, partial [Actinomycetota bacterium]|nr:NAD-binding protein [Actinomycetota bacterium]